MNDKNNQYKIILLCLSKFLKQIHSSCFHLKKGTFSCLFIYIYILCHNEKNLSKIKPNLVWGLRSPLKNNDDPRHMIILQGHRHHLRGNDGGEGAPISKAKASKTGETISVTEF